MKTQTLTFLAACSLLLITGFRARADLAIPPGGSHTFDNAGLDPATLLNGEVGDFGGRTGVLRANNFSTPGDPNYAPPGNFSYADWYEGTYANFPRLASQPYLRLADVDRLELQYQFVQGDWGGGNRITFTLWDGTDSLYVDLYPDIGGAVLPSSPGTWRNTGNLLASADVFCQVGGGPLITFSEVQTQYGTLRVMDLQLAIDNGYTEIILDQVTLGFTPPPAPQLVLWNKFGSQAELEASEVGAGFSIVGTIQYDTGKFGGSCAPTQNAGRIEMAPESFFGSDRTRGTVELWLLKRVASAEPSAPMMGVFGDHPYVGASYGGVSAWWGDGVTGPRGIVFVVRQDLAGTGGMIVDAVWNDLPTGVWFHLGFVWDLAGIEGSSDTMRIYRDGQVVASTTQTIAGVVADADPVVMLGQWNYNPSLGPMAYGDNLSVWDQAKTDFSNRFCEDPRDSNCGTRTVTVASVEGTAGSTVDVPVRLEALEGENAVALSVTFDPASLTSATPAVTLGSDVAGLPGATLLVNDSLAAAGKLGIGVGLQPGTSLPTGLREIVVLHFEVPSGVTHRSVALVLGDSPTLREVADLDGNPLPAAYVDGMVDIPNHPPVAGDDAYSTAEDAVLTVVAPGVLGNDTDADADPLQVTKVNGMAADVGVEITSPSGAKLRLNADGSLVYDPNHAFDSLALGTTGTDTFTYTVADGFGGSDDGLVTLTIEGREYESDVITDSFGDNAIDVLDVVKVGRYVIGLDPLPNPSALFRRVDAAPRSTSGNGRVTIGDWVQAGRYAALLDPWQIAAGPDGGTGPGLLDASRSSRNGRPAGPAPTRSDIRALIKLQPSPTAGKKPTYRIELQCHEEVAAASFSIRFDSTRLRFKKLTPGSVGASAPALYLNESALGEGRLGVLMANSPGSAYPRGVTTLGECEFQTVGDADGAHRVVLAGRPVTAKVASPEASPLAALYVPSEGSTLSSYLDWLVQRASPDLIDLNNATTAWGEWADLDGDGYSNVLEFMLGGNPSQEDVGLIAPKITADDGVPTFTVTLHRWHHPGYELTASYSSELSGWQPIAAATVIPVAEGVDEVRYAIPLTGQAGFLRFSVSTPSSSK